MANHVLKAAFHKVKITPEEPVSLQGYDPDTNRADPAKDAMDDLYARILILDDGCTRSLVVNVDCCLTNEESVKVADQRGRPGLYREFIPTFPEGTRRRWAMAAGADERSVSVNATHTHTAPAQWREKYIRRIEEAIAELPSKLRPVNVKIASGESRVSAFRRPFLKADRSVPVNQSLRVVYQEREEDAAPLGAIVNYAVHPTALRNPTSRISGDLVGLAIAGVEQRMGDDFVCLFLQGFSGDICPLYGDNGPSGDTYPAVCEGAGVLEEDILRTFSGFRTLPAAQITTDEAVVALPTREGYYKEAVDLRLVGIALGELLILSVSGEVFDDYIGKIDEVSPFSFNLLSGLSNGYSGYIPTHKAFEDRMGGYEMNTTPYDQEIEGHFMNAVKQFVRGLRL